MVASPGLVVWSFKLTASTSTVEVGDITNSSRHILSLFYSAWYLLRNLWLFETLLRTEKWLIFRLSSLRHSILIKQRILPSTAMNYLGFSWDLGRNHKGASGGGGELLSCGQHNGTLSSSTLFTHIGEINSAFTFFILSMVTFLWSHVIVLASLLFKSWVNIHITLSAVLWLPLIGSRY